MSPPRIVPAPASLETLEGIEFILEPNISIAVDASQSLPVGEYLADLLRRPTGFPIPVARQARRARQASQGPNGATQGDRRAERSEASRGAISLALSGSQEFGREGYRLEVARAGIRLTGSTPEGLFRGIQTILQLLPARIESASVQPGPWAVPAVRIVDRPRWAWRGSMLDVARHFISVAAVKRHIDLSSRYKLNVLHLHLSDDQGWRIHIDRWPRLAEHGGSLEVGGTKGGHYTKDDFREIVAYAAERHITLVPEIDMPGHTRAALASYPELNCDGRARPLYTGTDVGISSLCVGKEVTYEFVEDVVAEIAELTPGPYFHIGGDEAAHTSLSEYISFVKRAEEIVRRKGKSMLGWEEICKAELSPGSVVQFWNNGSGSPAGPTLARRAVEHGLKLVMSPSDRVYLDMKYDASAPLGAEWAGFIDVRRAYEWEPPDYIPEVGESDIMGVEAPLWTETITDSSELEYMVWPRLAGIAEVGWSPTPRAWDEYRGRLAAQGPRWRIMGVNFFRSPQVPWEGSSDGAAGL
jgi:hexosaminidase